MKFISLFTGVGGFDIGFEQAGMECVAQVEIDKFCTQVLEQHWPNVKRFTDVREFGRENDPSASLICGGFPCTDVSVAGKRAGLAGERSGLWFEYHRIVNELRPRWIVIENVTGLFSSNRGEDFATILSELAKLGYGYAWRTFNSQYFGVPQRRRRVFVVGYSGNWRGAAEILFEQESGKRYSKKSEETKQEITGPITPRIGKSHTELDGHGIYVLAKNRKNLGYTDTITTREGLRQNPSQDNYSIYSNKQQIGTGDNSVPLTGVRRLTPLECERLQGFSDNHTSICSDTQRYKQLGNAVTVNVAEWIGKRIMSYETKQALA